MGMLLCEQNFRDVLSRNESVRAEIGQMLHTHAAKLVVEMSVYCVQHIFIFVYSLCEMFFCLKLQVGTSDNIITIIMPCASL